MVDLDTNCPKCGTRLHIPDLGRSIAICCGGCGHATTVVMPNASHRSERILHVALAAMCVAGTLMLGGLFTLATSSDAGIQSSPPAAYSPAPVVIQAAAPTPAPLAQPAIAESPEPASTHTAPARPVAPAASAAAAVSTPTPTASLSDEKLRAVVRVAFFGERGETLGEASGFFVTPHGTVVTNHPATREAHAATVHTSDGQVLDAMYLTATGETDIALVQADATPAGHLPLGAAVLPHKGDAIRVADTSNASVTINTGQVRSLQRHYSGRFQVIETTAAVPAGSTGAPLLDTRGRVIGITSQSLSLGPDANFAIPVGKVREAIAHRGVTPPRALAAAEMLDGQTFHYVSDRDERLLQLEREFGLRPPAPTPDPQADAAAQRARMEDAKRRAAAALSDFVGTDLMPDPDTAQEVGVRLAGLRERGFDRPRDPNNFDHVPTFDLNVMSFHNADAFRNNMRQTNSPGEFRASLRIMMRASRAAYDTRGTTNLYHKLDTHWDFERYRAYGGTDSFSRFLQAVEINKIPPHLRRRAPGTGTGWGMSVSPGIPGGRVPRLAPRYDGPSPGEMPAEPIAPSPEPADEGVNAEGKPGEPLTANEPADVYLSASPVTMSIASSLTEHRNADTQPTRRPQTASSTPKPEHDDHAERFRARWGKYPWQF